MQQNYTEFVSYELTDQEFKEATTFTALQLAYLKNSLHDVALRKVNLSYNTDNHLEAVKADAFLAGQLSILREIIYIATNHSNNNN